MIIPDDAMPTQQRAKLVDFGLAKLTRFSGRRSSTGLIMGTPAYMSPEQCRGAGQVDDKTDCYALGVMLYELVAGRLPFDSQWAGDLIGMHLHVEPEPLEQRVPYIEPRLATFIHALLNKNKDQRPTMAEVAAQLAELLTQIEGQGVAPLPGCEGPEDALAPTLLGLQLQDSQRTEPDQPLDERVEASKSGWPPAQSELDELFDSATLARVLEGGISDGEPIGKRVLLTLKSAELPALKRALAISDQSPQRRCTCLGDLTIELCGVSGRVALFSYHYHDVGLLGYAGWDRDAQILKADAFLLLLGRHGVTAPGRKLFAEAALKRAAQKQQQVVLGESRRVIQPAVEQPESRAVLDGKLLLSRVTEGQSDADLDWTVQFLSTQQTLTSRAALLSRIPARRWEQLQAHIKAFGLRSKQPLLEHAQRVGQAMDTAAQLTPRAAGSELVKIVHCKQGPLSALVTDGVDLYGVAEQSLVRMAPFDGQFETVLSLPARDFELSCCGPSLLFACRSAGTVGRVHTTKARLEVLAAGRSSPHRLTHCGWRPHWLEQESISNARATAVMQLKRHDYSTEVARLATIGADSPGLLGDDEFLYALDPRADGTTQLKWFSQEGLAFDSVKPSAYVAPREGLSLLAQNPTHVFWPAEDRVFATRKLRLESTMRAIASGPIACIAPTEQGIFVVTGRPALRTWQVEFAPAAETATYRIGSFEHRESDRVFAVPLGETLYMSCGESIYLARARYLT